MEGTAGRRSGGGEGARGFGVGLCKSKFRAASDSASAQSVDASRSGLVGGSGRRKGTTAKDQERGGGGGAGTGPKGAARRRTQPPINCGNQWRCRLS